MTNDRPPADGDDGRDARRPAPADRAARETAVDPTRNIVLEASAGTGKTRVLVDRYVRLTAAGVDPANILAITFTRKAAAEMRQRIVARMREEAGQLLDAAERRAAGERLGDVTISTIDAFCLALLQEFPLEADVDPGFDVADETALPRLADETLDRAMRICRSLALRDGDIALLFSHLGEPRLRDGLAALLDRRLVAAGALNRVLRATPRDSSVDGACARCAQRLKDALDGAGGGLDRFLDSGPVAHPRYAVLAAEIRALASASRGSWHGGNASRLRALIVRLEEYLFTRSGDARQRDAYRADEYPGAAARRAHRADALRLAPLVADLVRGLRRELNGILARAVWRVFSVAVEQYERTLDARGVIDFAGLLARARALLHTLPEFGRSRYLLESRYQHLLVDEFQDTSRAQWELVQLLVRTWGEGLGLDQDMPLRPTLFVVGDRKQSIYGFRDAEVAVLGEAAGFVSGLRPEGDVGLSIAHSFRSVRPLLAFANDLFTDIEKAPGRADAFRFDSSDRFPLEGAAASDGDDIALGLAVGSSVRDAARRVAAAIARLIGTAMVRDRQTGLRRPAAPADVAVLFRTRESHREFERALDARGVPTYVYKGLGFFDADEILDIVALVRFLADPASNLRAAALLRSRIARLSDPGIQRLAPGVARSLTGPALPEAASALEAHDARVFAQVRKGLSTWVPMVDRVPPAELLDRILAETGYAAELEGPRRLQARENLKKIRALARRLQNRGYLTMARLAGHFERMSAGDEANAIVDAVDAVSLMTVHAAKGLEFPIVFLVNLSRGTGAPSDPIRIAPDDPAPDAVAVGDFQAVFDDDALARDREETKRLLYVAVTRARDRVVLSASLEGGRFSPRRGSLGEVLPAGVRDVIERAGRTSDGRVTWTAASGRAHAFDVCQEEP